MLGADEECSIRGSALSRLPVWTMSAEDVCGQPKGLDVGIIFLLIFLTLVGIAVGAYDGAEFDFIKQNDELLKDFITILLDSSAFSKRVFYNKMGPRAQKMFVRDQ